MDFGFVQVAVCLSCAFLAVVEESFTVCVYRSLLPCSPVEWKLGCLWLWVIMNRLLSTSIRLCAPKFSFLQARCSRMGTLGCKVSVHDSSPFDLEKVKLHWASASYICKMGVITLLPREDEAR